MPAFSQAVENPVTGQHDGIAAIAQAHFDTYLPQARRVKLGSLPISIDLYEHDTDAPCILFIPGIGTYSEYYCEYLSKLSALGFNVVGFDPRGHGYSGGARGYYRIEQVVSDLQLVLDYLGTHYSDRIGVVGCSIGSRLGLALAEADQRVRSLLCHTLFLAESPPDLWHQIGWQSLSVYSFWMPHFPIDLRNFIDIHGLMQEFPLGQYAISDQRMVWSYPVSTLNSVYSASSNVMERDIGIPCAVIIGENDQLIRPQYIEQLVARSMQKFDFIEVGGEGHMLPLSNSERMAEESHNWFDRTLK